MEEIEQVLEAARVGELTAGSAPLLIAGAPHQVPGVRVLANHATGAHDFTSNGRARSDDPTEIVIHESVTASREATVKVLARRKLGVHLIVDHDGTVTQHADLSLCRLPHAGPHNTPSIGLELVNLYYGGQGGAGASRWPDKLRGGWVHKGLYRIPTRAQLEACWALVRWITRVKVVGLSVPEAWPGVQKGRLWLTNAPGGQLRSPGIWAHAQTSNHADGSFPLLYCYLRAAGLEADEAYREAVERATGASRWVSVADVQGGVS